VEVCSVDLEAASPLAEEALVKQTCYCRQIRRVPASQLFDIRHPARATLLFCFGRRCPLDAYLATYPTCASVVLIGDTGGVTSPSADALRSHPEWSLVKQTEVRAVMQPTIMAFYEKTVSEQMALDSFIDEI
jgi:hypothetical protein